MVDVSSPLTLTLILSIACAMMVKAECLNPPLPPAPTTSPTPMADVSSPATSPATSPTTPPTTSPTIPPTPMADVSSPATSPATSPTTPPTTSPTIPPTPMADVSSPTISPTPMNTIVQYLRLIPHPEGGFFREVYRSGSEPMTTKGQTDFATSRLVTTDRVGRRPDGDLRRNEMTSIYWMPVNASPKLGLSINLSTHAHYYHGGSPFQFLAFDPSTGTLHRSVLGPDLQAGQRPQVIIPGGWLKCGHIVDQGESGPGYTLLGEAVAPGFDFYDFEWVTGERLAAITTPEQEDILRPYLHAEALQDRRSFVEQTEELYKEA